MSEGKRPPLLERGDKLGERWEILSHIATGGKGEVYRARQIKLEREVAVKIISPELIEAFEGDQEEIEAEMQRFRREVLAMAASRHRNVLQIYDFEESRLKKEGREIPLEYIVMEYIPGPTLASTMPPEGLRQDEEALKDWISRYFLPVLEGVAYLHGKGIVHRDLKPANVLLDEGVPKITDFGLVAGKNWAQVTRSHHVIGTLAYMAPEQFVDLADTDARADVYSLGKMLYAAAVGKLDKETMRPLKTARLPVADTPFLKALNRIIEQATAEEPGERTSSVKELNQALGRLLAGRMPPAGKEAGAGRPAWLFPGLIAAVLAAALAYGLWHHFSQPAGSDHALVSPKGAAPRAQKPVPIKLPWPPPPVITGRDGSKARLVPAGPVPLPAGGSIEVKAFYLDENEVTNHQYVEFLNRLLPRLEVSDGVVKRQGRIWLHLGEVRQGYRPVVHRQGRFQVAEPALAAHPVVRVTAYGAAAYAAFFGRRLPTRAEWLRAASLSKGSGAGGTSGGMAAGGQAGMHGHMNGSRTAEGDSPARLFAVTHFNADSLGLRGLLDNAQEWVVASPQGQKYMVMAPQSAAGAGSAAPTALPRHPWEAFALVGFRTALSAPAPPAR